MAAPAQPSMTFDLLIRNGTIYDGRGGAPYSGDIAINGDKIVAIGAAGAIEDASAGTVIDAAGLAVAPGFIDVLSHAYFTLLHDGRGLSALLQGVTTTVFGEGSSMGPIHVEDQARMRAQDPALDFAVEWTSLAEYLAYAEQHGIALNVASYIGATSLRMYVAGHENRPLSSAELDTVSGLVRDEMSAGALGIGSSLIYPPAFFASTDELIAMCRAAAPFGGRYISHMRNEGLGLLDGVAELTRIALEAGVPAEIYHLKASGQDAWPNMAKAIEAVETARAAGLAISADMYTYTAGATGLSNCIPPWFHEGGPEALYARLADPRVRAEIRQAITSTRDGWENLYANAGTPENILLQQTRTPELRRFQGKTLAEAATMLGIDPLDALMDLVRDDRSRITTAYFMMSEENVQLGLRQPWVSLGSDAGAVAAEGAFLTRAVHPRTYGNFARLLGRYVRDEQLMPLEEAVWRMTSLPADNLGLDRRGRLLPGRFADLVIFDPASVSDCATYAEPHQYATGIRDVIVNGQVEVRDGAFSGAFAGRALYGPGRR